MTVVVRPIGAADAPLVAHMHAASWKSAYRGLFSEAFLDREVDDERLHEWTQRLATPADSAFGLIAEVDDRPVGFIFMRSAHDPAWGTMLDNLHVLDGSRGQGVGRRLIAAAMRALLARDCRVPVWLWVYEQNEPARRVYARLGGREVERATDLAADGAERPKWRVVWDSPELLLDACEGSV